MAEFAQAMWVEKVTKCPRAHDPRGLGNFSQATWMEEVTKCPRAHDPSGLGDFDNSRQYQSKLFFCSNKDQSITLKYLIIDEFIIYTTHSTSIVSQCSYHPGHTIFYTKMTFLQKKCKSSKSDFFCI